MKTKQRILLAALKELERVGVEGFSLRSVSAAAGYTPMAIYRHYKNREELLAAAGNEAFATWKARVDGIVAVEPLDWLRKVSRAYVTFALDEPSWFDACFVMKTQVERIYPHDFEDRKSPVITMTMDRVIAAQATGALAPGDPLEIALMAWAELHGLAMLHRAGRFAMERIAFLALCDRCIERLLIRPAIGRRNSSRK